MGKSDPAVTEQKAEISPHLKGPSEDIVKAMMMSAGVNPWEREYGGPRMVAQNDAQKQAMDAAALRGQSMGFDFTPASQSLPETAMIDGVEVYDTLSVAQNNIPPALQRLYDQLYGPEGLMGKYAATGEATPQDEEGEGGGEGSRIYDSRLHEIMDQTGRGHLYENQRRR